MWHLSRVKRSIALLAVVLIWGTAVSASAQPVAAPPEPATYLCDAPDAPGPEIAETWLSQLPAAARLEEDDKSHAFRGRAVLMNDKIVAALEADSPGLAVYARQTKGSKLVARLQLMCVDRCDMKRTAIEIKENSRSTVALEVSFRSPRDEVCQVIYELNAGDSFIKTTAASGVEKLRVQAPCRLAVLPDFFADDIVVDAATIPVARAELPSENFLLHMMHGGEAVLMTVSESRDDDIVVQLAGGSPEAAQSREIVASDISFGSKPRIWVAVLAGEGIWHQRAIAAEDAGKVMRLDWKMPFAGLWRVDWTKSDKLSESWEMLLQDPGGKYVMQNWLGQKESQGQSFGAEFGPRDWNKPDRKRWNPVLGDFKFPCWIDNDRTGYLQPLERPHRRRDSVIPTFAGPAIIYPIDRVQAAPFATPLDQFTVVDLVRMTLGVGPCQYILDLEGQKRNSRGVATCYARDVINGIYKEGSQFRQGKVIEEQLDLCVAFIRNVRERIDQYVQFGHETKAYLEEQKAARPKDAAFLDEMLSLTTRLDQVFDQHREKIRTPADAEQNAADFRAKLLTDTEKGAYEKCAAQMGAFTSIGGAQDETVAECRMIVKMIRQRAGMAMAENPNLKDIATEIRRRTQVMLRNATAYEAPRH